MSESGLRLMMTNVRASNLHPTLQGDILHPVPSSLRPSFHPQRPHPPLRSFSRVLAVFPVAFPQAPLEPPASPLPSCLRPSSRRFAKLPLFLSRKNIPAASSNGPEAKRCGTRASVKREAMRTCMRRVLSGDMVC